MQPNSSGDQIILLEQLGQQNPRTTGIFKTYSRLDQLQIQKILKGKKVDKSTSLSIVWARFGKVTIFSKIKDELEILEELRQAM